MEPIELPDQFFGQLDAFWVYLETAFVDDAPPGNNIQITAWGSGEKYGTGFIFNLLEAAEAALPAEGLPNIIVVGLYHGAEDTGTAGGRQWMMRISHLPVPFGVETRSFCYSMVKLH